MAFTLERKNDRNQSKENSTLNENEYHEEEANMEEKVHLEIRFVETEDGFRWETVGDKDTLRKLGIGPLMIGRSMLRGLGNWERKARRQRWAKMLANDQQRSEHTERKAHRGGLRTGSGRRSCHGREGYKRRRPTGRRSHGHGHHSRIGTRDAQTRSW